MPHRTVLFLAPTIRSTTVIRSRRRIAAGLAAGALLVGLAGIGSMPDPAYAASSVTAHVVDRPDLTNVADPQYLTELQVQGSGFQSIKNGHGGIYVAFGWIDGPGTWQPSNGGTTGANYAYVPDDEANPTGYILFVTFPGSDTAYAANGGELAADGTWSGVISIPGASFEALDRDGDPQTVDCLTVQCGIITIGAHGVKNANNESFTPITFTDLYGDGAAAPAPAAAAPVSTPEPTVISSTIVAEPDPAAAASATDDLVPLLTGAIIGVGALALGAVGFLVWAVLSGRRRAARAAVTAAGPAPGGESDAVHASGSDAS
ncbi:hypothetical protein [Plantibacter sp. RU18]|uniref:hypothetical protein n=1 Tax=Plantibacter sp. RU18 TaxID=3158143 RepID=UPI003D360E7B